MGGGIVRKLPHVSEEQITAERVKVDAMMGAVFGPPPEPQLVRTLLLDGVPIIWVSRNDTAHLRRAG